MNLIICFPIFFQNGSSEPSGPLQRQIPVSLQDERQRFLRGSGDLQVQNLNQNGKKDRSF